MNSQNYPPTPEPTEAEVEKLAEQVYLHIAKNKKDDKGNPWPIGDYGTFMEGAKEHYRECTRFILTLRATDQATIASLRAEKESDMRSFNEAAKFSTDLIASQAARITELEKELNKWKTNRRGLLAKALVEQYEENQTLRAQLDGLVTMTKEYLAHSQPDGFNTAFIIRDQLQSALSAIKNEVKA